MIFYFSGTGNSQLAAKQIAEALGDEAVSINKSLQKQEKETFRSECPLVFVAPTYAWRIPNVVTRWIRETSFVGHRNAYFVLTCGGSAGNAATYARALCKQKGLSFCGLAPVLMPENYLAMYPTPDADECRTIIARAKPRIAELAALIGSGKDFPDVTVSFKDRLRSGPVNLLFYPTCVHDKGFTVSTACISCGKCATHCPLNNIDMVDKKPVWKGNCTHCMACIAGCPTTSIEYKSVSKNQHRHYIMGD